MGGSSIAERRRRGVPILEPDGYAGKLSLVAEILRRARRLLLTTHRSPDGDGIGAALGLAGALRSVGKEVVLYSADPVPAKLSFLAGVADFVAELPADARFDVTVVTDCADLRRLGPHLPDAAGRGQLIYIDHHPHGGEGADVHLQDDSSPAVGEMVARLLSTLGIPLSRDVALALYTSLMSDTGSFRYSNTSPRAMRCAAELLEAGIDPWEVSSNLYENDPVERLRLLALVLATLDVSPDGRCAALVCTRAMLDATHARPELLDGMINHARSIRGVEVAVFFREAPDGVHDVSFRSRGAIDVGSIAQAFGGGGHFHAAGCRVEGDLAAVRAKIYEAVRGALR